MTCHSLGHRKFRLRDCIFPVGCQENREGELGNNQNTPCGVDHVVQSKIQSLRREFENLAMKKDEKVSDFSSRFTKIISELRDLGERLVEKEVVAKLLRSMPVKYDSLTFSLEQFGNMRGLSVDEVIGSLRVHEQRLQERDSREEEQVLLS